MNACILEDNPNTYNSPFCFSVNAGVIWSWRTLSIHLSSSKPSKEFSLKMSRVPLRWHLQGLWRLRWLAFLSLFFTKKKIRFYDWLVFPVLITLLCNCATCGFSFYIIIPLFQTSREIKISGAIGPCVSLNAKGPCVSENVSSSSILNQIDSLYSVFS